MKNFFIGVDVSKRKIDVAILAQESDEYSFKRVSHSEFLNEQDGFKAMLTWVKETTGKPARASLFCTETTGEYDIAMCNHLYVKGISIWRENALQIRMKSGLRRGKDDVADAWVIAEYVARNVDQMQSYVPPCKEISSLKSLLRYRERLVAQKTELKVRTSELKALKKEETAVDIFIREDAEKQIQALHDSIEKCEKQMLALIKSDESIKKNYNHLCSVKGIGIINAAMMIAYTNNFRDFETANQLATYYGVATFRQRSGSSIDKRSDVRCYCNHTLKSYLSEAALASVNHDPQMNAYFQRMKGRKKHPAIAMNNVKNKLLHICFALIKNDCDYIPNYENVRKMKKLSH